MQLREQAGLPGRDSPINAALKGGMVAYCLDSVALEVGKKGNYRAITPYKPDDMRFLAILYRTLATV